MRLFLFIVLITCTALAGCKKNSGSMTVVIDCSGSYLRFEQKDYRVCNTDKLNGIANGTSVKARFETTSECTGAGDTAICYVGHPYESLVRITSLKVR